MTEHPFTWRGVLRAATAVLATPALASRPRDAFAAEVFPARLIRLVVPFASELSMHERARLAGATTHWLRHIFGTRAIARNVPLDVIQAQMGHASIQTTTAIYRRAPIKRRVEELGKAFS